MSIEDIYVYKCALYLKTIYILTDKNVTRKFTVFNLKLSSLLEEKYSTRSSEDLPQGSVASLYLKINITQ